MKKIITIVLLTMGLTDFMLGQEANEQSQKQITILPNFVEGTSKEMQALDNEVREWRNKVQTVENFKRMERRILQQIQKNPADRAEGYLRLGQMHRLQYCPEACSDSLAIYYYTKAEELLTRPCDKMFKHASQSFLARSYMLPGKFQNLYMAQQYYLKNLNTNLYRANEISFFYLFGWGVQTDLFLASQYFIQCILEGGDNINTLLLNYIQYLLNHKDQLNAPHNSYASLEDYAYTYYIQNSIYRGLYPLSLSAELGNAPAQSILGSMYCFGTAGVTDKSNRSEGYRLLKTSIKNGFTVAKYLLGLHCYDYFLDVDKGDIYETDENGNYYTSDLRRINKKAMNLMEEAAMQGNVNAINTLGKLYTNLYHDPTLNTDYHKAFYYLKVAEILGVKNLKMDLMANLRKEMAEQEVTIDESDSMFLTQNAHNLALVILYNNKTLAEQIEQAGEISHPHGGDRSNLIIKVPDEIMEKVHKKNPEATDADYMRAEAYAMLYLKYMQRLKEVSKEESTKDENYIDFLKQMMITIRKHSEKLPYNIIEPCVWEQ